MNIQIIGSSFSSLFSNVLPFKLIKNTSVKAWTDYVCQFCYIAKRELENALNETGLKEKVEITYKAYELVPNGATEPTTIMLEGLSKHTGMPESKVRQMVQRTIERAKGLGLDYRYDNMMWQSTLNAHRVEKYAQEEGIKPTLKTFGSTDGGFCGPDGCSI
ncbi:MAG: DsbA family protein [Bacillus sp. (in: firmicutes)]